MFTAVHAPHNVVENKTSTATTHTKKNVDNIADILFVCTNTNIKPRDVNGKGSKD